MSLKGKISLISSVIAIILISGCSNFETLQTPYNDQNLLVDGPIGRNPPQEDKPLLSSQGYRFSRSYVAAKTSPTPENLRQFLESGMAYADLQCRHYFSRIDLTRAHREHLQKQTTLVGSLTTALLGIADAGSAVTGAAGSAFGFASSSFDAYNSAFLASTDIGLLQDLVTTSQAIEKKKLITRITSTSGTWPQRTDTFDLALSDLDNYISKCTPTGIRNLLKASIQEKTNREAQGLEPTSSNPAATIPPKDPSPSD